MFDFITKAELQPWNAIFIGAIFVAVVSSCYRNAFSLSPHINRFKIIRNKVNSLSITFLKILKNIIIESWQFLSGVAFAGIVFAACTLLPGINLTPQALADSTAINSLVNTATRTVVDTSKVWLYDFSTQPDGPINTKIFNIENGPIKASYNNELETYTNRTSNVRVQDGVLVLEAKVENKDGKPYTSGRVDTNGSFSFIYGTLEVKAKIPRGVGTWPAGWLMPAVPRYMAKEFPAATDQSRLYSLNGELDFLESVGYLPGQNIPAAHSYDSLGQVNQYTPAYIVNPYDEYHTYGIVKTPNSIEFTIDGHVYAQRIKTSNDPLVWPYDQPYYLTLNLAIGGSWAGKEGIDETSAPWQYMIKSIHYTPLPSNA